MPSREQCLKILQLDASAGPNAIKKAYRKLAFELHPDLNPTLPDAHKRFQALNEAYVLLLQEFSASPSYTGHRGTSNAGGSRQHAGPGETGPAAEKARADAQKAYKQARKGFEAAGAKATTSSAGSSTTSPGATRPRQTPSSQREAMLRDLLNDPFARRVFEDIYSHVRYNSGKQESVPPAPPKRKAVARPAAKPSALAKAGGKVASLASGIKSWMRKQIDDEQVIFLPGESLHAGARVRLQVSHGLGGESRVIELTLPPEFKVGRPIRLKGMGKRLGSVKGDLYLRVYSKDEGEE